MTLRQRLRYIHLLWKKFRQARRLPDEIEIREILAEVLNERDLILRSVGGLTITWAELEMFLDYTNGLLALNPVLAGKKFPRTTGALDQKIDFLKDGFGAISELAALGENIPELVIELKRLQTIRNDVVHGVAMERTLVGFRKVMRVRAEGRFLDETYKTYSLAEISYAGVDAVKLQTKLISLFADTLRILDPDRAKQFVNELPSFSTISPPEPPPTSAHPATLMLGAAASEHQAQGHVARGLMILLFLSALAGLSIGAANASWLGVLLASVVWGILIWLFRVFIALVSGRAPKSDKLLFGSRTLTRFIVWCLISFAASLIIGSLTYAVRASLA